MNRTYSLIITVAMTFGLLAPGLLRADVDYDQYDEYQPPARPILTYAQVARMIGTKRIKSPDALIANLPKKYRESVALAYQSRSLQYADCVHPRIVFFGPDAKLIIAVTGSPDVPGGNTVEISEWNPRKNEFEYHEITFPNAQHSGGKSCASCHGENPRPNWDAYNGWRGFFGSLSRQSRDVIAWDSAEMNCFKEFQTKSAGRGRYASIETKLAPPTDSMKLGGVAADIVQIGAHIDTNSRFTHFIGILNMNRVTHILNTLPNRDRNKYLLAALAANCDIDENFVALLPKGVETEEKARSELLLKLKSDFERREKITHSANDPIADYFRLQNFAKTEIYSIKLLSKWYALQKLLGIDLREYSTGFTDGAYSFTTPRFDFWSGIQSELYYELGKNFELAQLISKRDCKTLAKKFTALYPAKSVMQNPHDCDPTPETLDKKNRETVDGKLTKKIELVKQPLALRLCISCHTAPNNTGPEIPFHTPERLTAEQIAKSATLMKSTDATERMPKDYPALSESEQSAIIKFLEAR